MALARERRCSPMRLLIRFGRRTEGVQGASGKPPLQASMCANLVIRTPSLELDAPTMARTEGLPP